MWLAVINQEPNQESNQKANQEAICQVSFHIAFFEIGSLYIPL